MARPIATARRPLRSRTRGWARFLARTAADAGLRPNRISLLSICFATAAGAALLCRWNVIAAVLIQLRLLANLLDGMVAVEGGLASNAGPVFNELPDRISDAIILAAAGYSTAWPYAPAAGWAAAVLAILTAYVRALAGSLGAAQDFCGPMAKPHRMAVLTVACVLSAAGARLAIPVALVVIAAGSAITAARRTLHLVCELEAKPWSTKRS